MPPPAGRRLYLEIGPTIVDCTGPSINTALACAGNLHYACTCSCNNTLVYSSIRMRGALHPWYTQQPKWLAMGHADAMAQPVSAVLQMLQCCHRYMILQLHVGNPDIYIQLLTFLSNICISAVACSVTRPSQHLERQGSATPLSQLQTEHIICPPYYHHATNRIQQNAASFEQQPGELLLTGLVAEIV